MLKFFILFLLFIWVVIYRKNQEGRSLPSKRVKRKEKRSCSDANKGDEIVKPIKINFGHLIVYITNEAIEKYCDGLIEKVLEKIGEFILSDTRTVWGIFVTLFSDILIRSIPRYYTEHEIFFLSI